MTLSENLTKLESFTFGNCEALTGITIPNSVTVIGDAFYGCKGLTEITLPESVKTLGSSAFYGCSGLKQFSVLNRDLEIITGTFVGCPKFTIRSYAGSKAEEFANFYKYPFEVLDNAAVTTTTNTTMTTGTEQTTTVTTVTTAPSVSGIMLGDVNDDKEISVEDAQLVLIEYVSTMSGLDGSFTEKQNLAGDVNGDKAISVEDAQTILLYYVSNTLSGKNVTWDELLTKNTPTKSLPKKLANILLTVYHRKTT